MSTAVTPFAFEGHHVRITMEGDDPWFVVADVGRAVGAVNLIQNLQTLREDEKGLKPFYTPGGRQMLRVVSEAGLYRLIVRCDMPKARPFQDWVTRDVLPSIRKNGAYVMGQCSVSTPGGIQTLSIVNEGGLYTIILRCRDAATPGTAPHRFRRWVTSSVLPSIRKNGAYVMGQEKVATGEMTRDELMAKAHIAALAILNEMEGRALAAESRVMELEPAAAVAEETFNLGRRVKLHDFARRLDGVNSMAVKKGLLGTYLYRQGGLTGA